MMKRKSEFVSFWHCWGVCQYLTILLRCFSIFHSAVGFWRGDDEWEMCAEWRQSLYLISLKWGKIHFSFSILAFVIVSAAPPVSEFDAPGKCLRKEWKLTISRLSLCLPFLTWSVFGFRSHGNSSRMKFTIFTGFLIPVHWRTQRVKDDIICLCKEWSLCFECENCV